MTSPEQPTPKISWETIDAMADEGEVYRLKMMTHDELEAELRSMGIEPERADQIVLDAIAKAEAARGPASE